MEAKDDTAARRSTFNSRKRRRKGKKKEKEWEKRKDEEGGWLCLGYSPPSWRRHLSSLHGGGGDRVVGREEKRGQEGRGKMRP